MLDMKDKKPKDDDIRKEIEELEKLIEIVKEQQKEERNAHDKSQPKPSTNIVRIDLAQKYSSNGMIHAVVSFLVNFILIYSVIFLLGFAEVKNDYLYLLIALMFTVYEEAYKGWMIRHLLRLVIYSSGLIFFLMNVIFFYLADLLILGDLFSFVNYLYPMAFVLIFQFIRMVIKIVYHQIIQKLSMITTKKS